MTIARQDGWDSEITFCCDGNGCNEVFETDLKNFSMAKELLRDEGWRTVKVGDEWQHLCEDCQSG